MLKRIRIKSFFLLFILFFFSSHIFTHQTFAVEGNKDYTLGPQDVIKITVWDNPDLSGTWAISLQGEINYQFVGDIKAAGLTATQFARELMVILADGYLINPQVTVEVIKYLSQKIVVIGEVKSPGTYYLTKRITLVEVISMAGGSTKEADREIILVRQEKEGNLNKEIKRYIDFRAALEGNFKENIFLKGGDTIFVPKAKEFFISGEVNSPGKYSLEKGTTVRNAITIAGGETEKASLSGIQIIRKKDKTKIELEVELDSSVQHEDTIIIPESFF